MKRLAILLLSLLLLLEGCSSSSPSSSPTPKTESRIEESKESDSPPPSPTDNTASKFPEYYELLIASYDDSAEKYNLSYKHPLSKIFHEEKDSDYYKYSYNFGIQSLSDSSSCETVCIKERTDGTLEKSFKVSFPSDFDSGTLRDFVLATIIMANPSANYENAMSDMQSFINSFNGEGYSSIYQTETYSLLLNSETLIVPCTAFYVMYNDEINPSINNEEFSPGTFETISSPLNANLKIFIDATISGDLETDQYGFSILNVTDESGNSFLLHFSYPDFCIDLTSGKKYTFYGVITKTSGLRLEHFIECENN